ncbi:heme-binding protein 2 isoform X2 [Amborella trichopoda]|uniref:heme-binding protein 2 isoform X2 n=1 Tax=Amborella trichopoda TaxID=13333 RepID=UPI0009C03A4A|nr:heme-binding protein 2 isoform X2 [Amborella trichopoda]|eukprot:XP_020520875.1 heme-binding protein 2 isoform X2 [Amborella trichopoda]
MMFNFPRFCVLLLWVFVKVEGIESPQFTVIHTESDFEIRLYRESSWMSAPVQEISFVKATKQGFHRLFQYIQGANLNSSRLRITAPVLTSIVPGAGPLHSSAYYVSHYVAVRKFSGFAMDSDVIKEAQSLAVSLEKSPWANSTVSEEGKYAYSIAQYSSPFKLIGRVNEVWVDVVGPATEVGVE